jgi:hypothetical protein
MGTSQSSRGPGGGIPMVPPWTPPPPENTDQSAPADQSPSAEDAQESPPQSVPVAMAPANRFGATRTSLGRFAASGHRDDLRAGLSSYTSRGYGGPATAARRMAGSAHTAGTLYGVLADLSAGRPTADGRLDPAALSGRSASEVMDVVVEVTRPIDGTLDTEAARNSIREALAELLTDFPDADLLSLSETHINFVVEQYIGNEVAARILLDVGKAVQDRAANVGQGITRLSEIVAYAKSVVAAAFRDLRQRGESVQRATAATISQSALRETFAVFAEYV